jgi:hypothetical protein
MVFSEVNYIMFCFLKSDIKNRGQTMHLALRMKQLATHFKAIRSVLPICSHCKRIRNQHGNWLAVELPVLKHMNIELSHSICPDCAKEYYSEFYP